MMKDVVNLIEMLVSSPGLDVRSAGKMMLDVLSAGSVSTEMFRGDPRCLTGPDHGVSRYLSQVIWRALEDDYSSFEDLLSALYGVVDRNPATLESRTRGGAGRHRVVIPEAKILRIQQPVETSDGDWEAAFEAQVTAGPLRESEIEVRVRSSVNPRSCFIIPYFWVHASIAIYNIVPISDRTFEDCRDTFFVLEPLRQVNATSVARALNCPKPLVDQARRGRGDVTIHTLRGLLVHSMFDRILEGEDDISACFKATLPGYLVQIAAVTDSDFDEDEFRAEVLRHAAALKAFVDLNPHIREDPQLELRRYSATLGLQGRIDAASKTGDRLDVVELKTGKRLREEDHAQLFIYRLLLSDWLRRREHQGGEPLEVVTRLLSSHDGTSTLLCTDADFTHVLEARNRLAALSYALGRFRSNVPMRYANFNSKVCGTCPPWTRRRCTESTEVFGDRPDVSPSPDLEYFQRFSTLVQAEKWEADKDLSDLLDDSRLNFRVLNFKTICNARCAGLESGQFVFKFEENDSDLTSGDRVLIHSGRISSSPTFQGYLRSIGSREARISVPLKNLSETTFKGPSWTIDHFPSERTSEASQTALYDFLVSRDDVRKRIVLGDLELALRQETRDAERATRTALELRSELNPRQIEAVRRALECRVFHLIWGPPGTGKTKVVSEIVANAGGSVLLGAFTNTAVDKMLLAMLDHNPQVCFLRIGRSKDSPELARRLGVEASRYFSDDLASSAASARELREKLDSVQVVASTAHRASSHPYLRGRSFELTLVDEAGQLTEPLTLGLVMRACRFVLIGDDRQLPPVVRLQGLGRSMFERLKEQAEFHAPELLTLLDTQYRMHPEIMKISNKLYYSGRLSSGVAPEDRISPLGFPILFLPVRSNSDGRSNRAEARVVSDLVGKFRKHVPAESIGVISPFRAQVALLRRMLENTGVVVDTVERFQGGERDVIVISFVRSRGTGFVFDDRRFNVAVTRARRKLVMVAHPDLFRDTRYEWICNYTDTPSTGVVG